MKFSPLLPLVLLAVLCQCISLGFGYRILLTPPPFESQIVIQTSIAEELIQRGHEVYITLGSRYSKSESILQKRIQILHYYIPPDFPYTLSKETEIALIEETVFNPPDDLMQAYIEKWTPLYDGSCDFMMADNEFLERVKRLQFDIAIVNLFPPSVCKVILPHFLRIPFVTVAIPLYPGPWFYGIPALPSFFPLPMVKSGGVMILPDLNKFSDRLSNTIAYLIIRFKVAPMMWGNTKLLKQFAQPDITSWMDLLSKSQLFLLDIDHHLYDAVPTMPNVVSTAGITVRPAKQLPESLHTIYQKSGDNGVIFLSFGSTAYFMPRDVIGKFFDAFSRLDYTVIARLPAPEGVKVPRNVKLVSWLPQNDILGHNKTRLFITHCGNNGQYEALYHGVPMLGFPLFAEQSVNCEQTRRKGFGLTMNIRNFTAVELYDNIRKMLDESSYTKAIKKASAVFKDQPMTGREAAAFWIEHVIRHGGDHLRPPTLDMPLYQFLMLDILTFFIVLLLVLSIVIMLTFRLLVRKCFNLTKTKSKSD